MKQSKTICFVSTLNPIYHPRILKEASSAIGLFDRIIIVGQESEPLLQSFTNQFLLNQIEFVPLHKIKRFSWHRFVLPLQIMSMLIKFKADIYHIHTPELLYVGVILRWILKYYLKCRIIYDVHEDYYLNIRHSGTYPDLISRPIAWLIRLGEFIFVKFYDAVILSEKCFIHNFKHIASKTYVIRNLHKDLRETTANDFIFENLTYYESKQILNDTDNNLSIFLSNPYCIYSGSFSDNWGVIESIELYEKILSTNISLNLVITGYGKDSNYVDSVISRINVSPHKDKIKLFGGHEYIPPQLLSSLISGAEFGFALYKVQKHIRERIPSKFYEYMFYKIPLIFTQNETWEQLNKQYQFGISISNVNLNITGEKNELHSSLKEWIENLKKFNPKYPIPEEVFSWKSEEKIMQNIWRNFLIEIR